MSERITVLHVVKGTVVEETHTAERVTFQRFADGSMLVKLWTGGRVTEYVSYRRVERAHRVIGVPREERA